MYRKSLKPFVLTLGMGILAAGAISGSASADNGSKGAGTISPADTSRSVTAPAALINGKIAFTGGPDGAASDIYVMNPDGSGLTNLTNTPGVTENYPTWSPDGTKIAFVRLISGQNEIYKMDANGANPLRLTNNMAWDTQPDWSPNGNQIAFISDRDGHYEIYVMDADGNNQSRRTITTRDEYEPDWLPNGRITFAGYRDDANQSEVYVMDASGANLTRITNNSHDDYSPEFSRDSNTIVFSSRPGTYSDIYVMNPNGSGITHLTTTETDEVRPSWAPDKTKVLYNVVPHAGPIDGVGGYRIFAMNADGTNQTDITPASLAGAYDPQWQPIDPCLTGFSDVPAGSTFYTYVQCLVCRDIINGYSDGTFRPGNNVTRGQLSKIVSESAGFNGPPGLQLYQDVPPGSTFYDYINRLAQFGYVNGYPCGQIPSEPCTPEGYPYFRPNGNATRAQIAKIISNAAGLFGPAGNQLFEDVPPGSTFYDYIQRLANINAIQGYPCGGTGEPCGPGNLPYFRPGNNATRGQLSKINVTAFFPECLVQEK